MYNKPNKGTPRCPYDPGGKSTPQQISVSKLSCLYYLTAIRQQLSVLAKQETKKLKGYINIFKWLPFFKKDVLLSPINKEVNTKLPCSVGYRTLTGEV